MSTEARRPGRPRSAETLRTVTLSLPSALVERLEAARALFAIRPSRSGVGCLAVERGLAVLEHEARGAPGGALDVKEHGAASTESAA